MVRLVRVIQWGTYTLVPLGIIGVAITTLHEGPEELIALPIVVVETVGIALLGRALR